MSTVWAVQHCDSATLRLVLLELCVGGLQVVDSVFDVVGGPCCGEPHRSREGVRREEEEEDGRKQHVGCRSLRAEGTLKTQPGGTPSHKGQL